ncbi:hypothetical protein EBB56_00690 [Halomonas sp. YLB-10]|uniref:hypothetical protein n=1 Tax=Halomonas sp. YLB-10 TaxID=2483111 RepID=UPI000F5F43D0|nr:hypothetical protein [Halomonas sp. YLB-10]RQW72528.1 hypothetical protein EBB56_00690 [Halomonas sp. YLB-10]
MKAALTILKRLGHLQELPRSKQMVFKDTVIGPGEPEIKNGGVYYLEELPLFEDQEFMVGQGMIKSRYEMGPTFGDKM